MSHSISAKHFNCNACGKCCYGQLPLTIEDAFKNVERFPICFIWTPLHPTNKDYRAAKGYGVVIPGANQTEITVLIVPTSFIPSTLPCPSLQDNNLCGIHEDKPLRCKTMPFYPYKDERFQADLLSPRKGWECDVSNEAPIVYDEGKIIDRLAFDNEGAQLRLDVSILQVYADYMLKYTHGLAGKLSQNSTSRNPQQMITSLSSFLTATRNQNSSDIASKQLPVLDSFVKKTECEPQLKDFHRYYASWYREMEFLSKRKSSLNNYTSEARSISQQL
ncbi:MAG: YkgJ family cysteine cluster protein [Proteobacteria bacterium]|nr:YkgJ family cysteine cluster protein [Pseudomonadota bacterium]